MEPPRPNFSEIPWIVEHVELYRTDPEKAHMWDSAPLGGPGLLPTLLLTTKGRKSGEPRALPLIYGTVGGSHVVVASKGGMSRHPVWYLNLEANPDVEVELGRERIKMSARRASDEEKARLWPKLVAMYRDYDDYQARTDRDIPVVILSPR